MTTLRFSGVAGDGECPTAVRLNMALNNGYIEIAGKVGNKPLSVFASVDDLRAWLKASLA